jgi:glucose-6-phosphate 1-epimerase
MDLKQLPQQFNDQFGIPGVLRFDEHNGLTRAIATTPSASAILYLQGAHLTHWQPAGQGPVLFLSRKSDLAPGKPIRGGVPIAFPWFATDSKPDRFEGKPGPSHGFARIQPWTPAFAAL